MIIKSMSRKQPSFTQLYDYIVRDHDNDAAFNFTHNFFGYTREEILDEFNTNARLLRKVKKANYLYHEILSVTRSSKISEEKQKEILHDIAQQYIQNRANGCLVFAGMHDEKDNQLHYHFIVSANEVAHSHRFRMTKSQFDEAKRQTELYVLERYPEMEQDKLISKDKDSIRNSKREGEYKRRTGKQSKKDYMKDTLRHIFSVANTAHEYVNLLRAAELETYARGNTMGYFVQGEKHRFRLNTLGLSEEFDEMQYRFSQNQQSDQQSQESKEQYAREEQTDDDIQSSYNEPVSEETYSDREKEVMRRKQAFKDRQKKAQNSNTKDRGR